MTREEFLRRLEPLDGRIVAPNNDPVYAMLHSAACTLMTAGTLGGYLIGTPARLACFIAGGVTVVGVSRWARRRKSHILRAAGLVCPRCDCPLPVPDGEEDHFLVDGKCWGCNLPVIADPVSVQRAQDSAQRAIDLAELARQNGHPRTLPPMTALGER